MTLRSLALRTKKSLSGLYNFAHVEQASVPPETPKRGTAPSPCTSTPDRTPRSPAFEEYALSPSSLGSSKTDSPSKRGRLVRSLRKMRSSFDVIRGKSSEERRAHMENTPPNKPRPSLTLDFEVSPPGQPMFTAARMTPDPSRVHHSSPIPVPNGNKSVAVSEVPVPVGAVPESPAPLVKVCVRETLHAAPTRFNEALSAPTSPVAPLPTPMPGTNLPLDDVQTPEIILSHPSVPLMDPDGYFALTAMQDGHSASKQQDPATAVSAVPEQTNAERPASQATARKQESGQTGSEADTILGEHSDQFALEADARKSIERKGSFVSSYLALGDPETLGDTQRKLVRRRSTWSRHTGLYDGTGYAASDSIEDDRTTQNTADHRHAPESPPNATNKPSTPSTTPAVEPQTAAVDEKQALQDALHGYTMYSTQSKESATAKASATSFENSSKEHIRAASQPIGAVGLTHKAMPMGIEA